MSKELEITVTEHETEVPTLRGYFTGFVLSIILTITAYLLVIRRSFSIDWIVSIVVGLALIQFFVQLYYFLHLGKETKPRWKLLVLVFMIVVVLILVLGSVWIMNNLNYTMTPSQMNTYLNNQGGGF